MFNITESKGKGGADFQNLKNLISVTVKIYESKSKGNSPNLS